MRTHVRVTPYACWKGWKSKTTAVFIIKRLHTSMCYGLYILSQGQVVLYILSHIITWENLSQSILRTPGSEW